MRRDFVRIWGSQIVSNLGDWVYPLAVAITLSQRLDGGSLARTMAFLVIAQVGSQSVFGALLAGSIVDRFSRRRVMIVADIVRALAVGSLLLTSTPSPLHFGVVAVCLGIFGSMFQPALLSSIPNVVDEERVVAANAVIGTTLHASIMLGPAIGALLVSTLGFAPAFAVNALSFAISALLLAGVRLPRPTKEEGQPWTPIEDLKEGTRYILRSPLVRGMMISFGLLFLVAGGKPALEPVFVRDVLTPGGSLSARAWVLGLLTIAWGGGMVLGSAIAPALCKRWRRERLIGASVLVSGACILLGALVGIVPVVGAAWLIAGAGNGVVNVSLDSLLQERTPDEVRGRVFSALDAVVYGSYLLGALLVAEVGSRLPVSTAFVAIGVGFLAVGLLALRLIPVGQPHAVEETTLVALPDVDGTSSAPETTVPDLIATAE
jgi:MFS family permease